MSDEEINILYIAKENVSEVSEKVKASLTDNISTYKDMNRQYRENQMVWRVQNYEMIQGLRIMTSVGSIGRSVLSMWQAHTLGQIRVEAATRNTKDAQKELAKWQELANQYLRDFGADSSYYLDAMDHVDKALSDVADMQATEAKATQDMNSEWLGMGLTAVGVAGQIGMLVLKLGQLGALSGVLPGFSTALLSALPALTPLLPMVGGYAVGSGIPLEEIVWGKGQQTSLENITKPSTGEQFWPVWLWDALTGWMQGLKSPLPGGQFGIPEVPETGMYLLHQGERVTNPRFSTGTELRNVNITQYNTISKEADFDTANDRAYRELLNRLGRKMG